MKGLNMSLRSKLRPLAFFVAISIGLATPAQAQTKLRMGVTPIGDYITAYVAKDSGIFAKHGLDVTLQSMAISPMAAAALVSGSLDLATPTAVDLLQAADGGIDLVALGSVGVIGINVGTDSGVLVRPEANIAKPADYVGKKIGVPSVGGLLHVLFRNYLIDNKVDPEAVNYVELGVPTHFDALRSGSVDGVVTADPIMSRIQSAKVGVTVLSFANAVPKDTVTGLVVTTRAFAEKNPGTISAFRAAWAEATALVISDHEGTRQAIMRHLKLPPPVAASLRMPLSVTTDIRVEQLQWWLEVMQRQKMLRGNVDLSKLIAKR